MHLLVADIDEAKIGGLLRQVAVNLAVDYKELLHCAIKEGKRVSG